MTYSQLAASDGLTDYVASEIRAQMGRLNISRSELARRMRVDDTWIGKRLNGRTEIGLSDLQRICDALGIRASELVRRAERQAVSSDGRTTSPYEPTVTGTTPWPDHPIIATALTLPLRAHTSNDVGRADIAERRTAPTGR